jgi:hypothetical protein
MSDPEKVLHTYRFVSDYAVVTLSVSGEESWTDEMYDDTAQEELASIVINPESFYQDEVW